MLSIGCILNWAGSKSESIVEVHLIIISIIKICPVVYDIFYDTLIS